MLYILTIKCLFIFKITVEADMDLYPNFIPGEKEMRIRVYTVLRGWKNSPPPPVDMYLNVLMLYCGFLIFVQWME